MYIPLWKDFKDLNLKDKNIDIAILAFAKIDKTNVYFDLDPAKNEIIKENIKKLQGNNKKRASSLVLAAIKRTDSPMLHWMETGTTLLRV